MFAFKKQTNPHLWSPVCDVDISATTLYTAACIPTCAQIQLKRAVYSDVANLPAGRVKMLCVSAAGILCPVTVT